MKLLRVSLLMLLGAVKISALTIENKTPTELTVSITSQNHQLVASGSVSSNDTKNFPLTNKYQRYTVRVTSSGGLINQNSYGYDEKVRYSGDGKTHLDPY